MKIMILGDVHGEWGALNTLLNKKRPDIVLQCGDFGFWPNMKEEQRKPFWWDDKKYGRHTPAPKMPEGCQLYWCDGNHEDHWALRKPIEIVGKQVHQVFWPNVIYMPRGTIMEISGLKVMFVGGAQSTDKEHRKFGYDWFPEEVVSMTDFASFPPATKVDVVISHTCPWEFAMREGFGRENDCSRTALSHVLEVYQPSKWFFGHWHDTTRGVYRNEDWKVHCSWQCMSMAGCTGWWQWLK